MGNLFLREKENWLGWSIWAIVGAFFTFYVAITTHASHFIVGAALSVLVILTIWMHQSKRFDFARAFKVSFFVLILSILPAFFLVIAPTKGLTQLDLIFQGTVLVSLSVLLCLICSFIARKPKQYY
jgi:hypothetical protein